MIYLKFIEFGAGSYGYKVLASFSSYKLMIKAWGLSIPIEQQEWGEMKIHFPASLVGAGQDFWSLSGFKLSCTHAIKEYTYIILY